MQKWHGNYSNKSFNTSRVNTIHVQVPLVYLIGEKQYPEEYNKDSRPKQVIHDFLQ